MPLTMFCAFTRPWAIDRWLWSVSRLGYDPKQMNLAFIVDADLPDVAEKLMEFGSEHRSVVIRINADNIPREAWPEERRRRIVEIKNQSREIVADMDGDIVIGLEDDAVGSTGNLHRLVDPIKGTDQIGFVEGVQAGRWGIKMVGVWKFDDFRDPDHAYTLLPGEGYQEIDGGGFYGYATRKNLYVDCEYSWEPWQPWGPDVNFGRYVKQQGHTCYVDWDTKFGHALDNERVLDPDVDLVQISYQKTEHGWVRTDHEKSQWE